MIELDILQTSIVAGGMIIVSSILFSVEKLRRKEIKNTIDDIKKTEKIYKLPQGGTGESLAPGIAFHPAANIPPAISHHTVCVRCRHLLYVDYGQGLCKNCHSNIYSLESDLISVLEKYPKELLDEIERKMLDGLNDTLTGDFVDKDDPNKYGQIVEPRRLGATRGINTQIRLNKELRLKTHEFPNLQLQYKPGIMFHVDIGGTRMLKGVIHSVRHTHGPITQTIVEYYEVKDMPENA